MTLAAMLLLAGLAAQDGFAQDPGAWEALSQERRERVLSHYARYQRMPPKDRLRLKERFALFRRLPAQRRQELVKRWEDLRSLAPERQRALRERPPGVRGAPRSRPRSEWRRGGLGSRMERRPSRQPRLRDRGHRSR